MPNKIEGVQPYALFMFCGILPWTWFSSSLTEAAGSLIAGGNLIKKVLFPAEMLPIVSVLANMVNFLLGLLILIPFLIYYRRLHAGPELLWFPVTVLVQLVFTTGLALILSALTVHFRDIRDLLANVLMLWFFATPIIYSWRQENVQRFKPLFDLNPFTHLAMSYQEILFFGPVGHWKWLLALGAALGRAVPRRLLALRSAARFVRRGRMTPTPSSSSTSRRSTGATAAVSSRRSRARCCSAASCAICSRARRSRR